MLLQTRDAIGDLGLGKPRRLHFIESGYSDMKIGRTLVDRRPFHQGLTVEDRGRIVRRSAAWEADDRHRSVGRPGVKLVGPASMRGGSELRT